MYVLLSMAWYLIILLPTSILYLTFSLLPTTEAGETSGRGSNWKAVPEETNEDQVSWAGTKRKICCNNKESGIRLWGQGGLTYVFLNYSSANFILCWREMEQVVNICQSVFCTRSYLTGQILQLKRERKLPLLAQMDVERVLCWN